VFQNGGKTGVFGGKEGFGGGGGKLFGSVGGRSFGLTPLGKALVPGVMASSHFPIQKVLTIDNQRLVLNKVQIRYIFSF